MSISENFKEATKKVKNQDLKVIFNNEKIPIKDIKYSFDGSLFKSIMKQLIVKTKNTDIKKKDSINFEYGLYVENDYEYVKIGEFYIKDEPEFNKGSKELEITCYDKMLNFMKIFKQEELNISYPCALIELLQKICEVCGVEIYSTDFFNNNLLVDEDYFTAQQITYRDVLDKIAQATLTTIYILEEKLYLAPILSNSSVVEILDKSYLTKLVITDKFGPVNSLVLGRGSVEDNIESRDDDSILQNGRCEIRFDENEFLDYKREEVIDAMFEQIKGLTYYGFEASDLGIMWLNPVSNILLKDKDNNVYNSYYLKADITMNTGIKSTIEAKTPAETETEYKVTSKENLKLLEVERIAKKNEGIIEDLIVVTEENKQQMTDVKQTNESITTKITDIEQGLNTTTGELETINSSVNEIKETVNGMEQTLQTQGGSNLLLNSSGLFGNEYWDGNVKSITNTEIQNNFIAKGCFNLQNGIIEQTIKVTNGSYYIGFKYQKLLELANCSLKVNDEVVELTENSLTEVDKIINVREHSITIELISDTDNACLIGDIIVVQGNKQSWSSNMNEIYTATVKIGIGLEITSNTMKTRLLANADGVRIINTNTGKTTSEFTDLGMKTDEIEAKKGKIAGLLIQNVNGQIWLSNINGGGMYGR